VPARSRPRYQDIAAFLRELIGQRRPGDRLPPEAELCRRFGVSRMTARQAVQVLEQERLLYRRRGKGTFVSRRPVPRLLGSPLSFTESMRRRGLAASSQVMAALYAAPSAEDAAVLEIADGQGVGVLERLRLADGVPMAIERVVLAPGCAAVIDTLQDGSLHAAFRAIGLVPTRAAAKVEARLATEEERELLQLGPSGVVLCERRVIYDQYGRPLEHTETRYAADRYVFDTMMQSDEAAEVVEP
jgi:GntR family transcriptional regulator